MGQRRLYALYPVHEHVLQVADALRLDGAEGRLHELADEVLPKRLQDGVGGNVREKRRYPEEHLARKVKDRGQSKPQDGPVPCQRAVHRHCHQAVHRIERNEPRTDACQRNGERGDHLPFAPPCIGEKGLDPRPSLRIFGGLFAFGHGITSSQSIRAGRQPLPPVFVSLGLLSRKEAPGSAPFGRIRSVWAKARPVTASGGIRLGQAPLRP